MNRAAHESRKSQMSLSEHPLFDEFDGRLMTVLGWLAGAVVPLLFAIGWVLDVPVGRITGAFAVAVVVYGLIHRLTDRRSELLSSVLVMAGFAVISRHYPDLLRAPVGKFTCDEQMAPARGRPSMAWSWLTSTVSV